MVNGRVVENSPVFVREKGGFAGFVNTFNDLFNIFAANTDCKTEKIPSEGLSGGMILYQF